MTSRAALGRQRAVVKASLDLPHHAVEEALGRLQGAIHREACGYLGEPPPGNGPEWKAWRTRIEAFEWLIAKRLLRESRGP